MIVDIAFYIVDYQAILEDGQTIGMREDQKLEISESPGIALDSSKNRMKIE